MKPTRLLRRIIMFAALLPAIVVLAQAPAPPEPGAVAHRKTMMNFIEAGGPVGYVIILLSVVAVALVIEAFIRIRHDKLMPPSLGEQLQNLARGGKFGEMLSISKTHESMLGRIVAGGLSRGEHGLPAIREGLQDQGTREVAQMQQRIGYISLIASVAPMLGLLGTVTGMVTAFDVLGTSKGAARPDELAVGIAEALITTVDGLVLALPLLFLNNFFRNRITGIGQEASSFCEQLLRTMAVALEARQAGRAHAAPVASAAGAARS